MAAADHIEPLDLIGSGRKVEREIEPQRTFEIRRVLPAWLGEHLTPRILGQPLTNRLPGGLHLHKLEVVDEILQQLHLLAKDRIATARLARRILEGAVLVPCGERVIEVVEKPAAGEDELPRLHPVMSVRRALEAGLVVADHFVEPEVERDRGGRVRIVKVEDGDGRMRAINLLGTIGDVLRDEMRLREILFRSGDDVRDAVLPGDRHAAEIRLVADLVAKVLRLAQFGDDLADERFLHREQATAFVERVDVVPTDSSNAVDVVRRVHRAQLPLGFLIHRAEERQLDDDAALAGLGDEILQPGEVGRIPLSKVEFIAPAPIAWLLAACPRAYEATRLRCQRIFGDIEGALRLEIRAAERASEVQPIRCECFEILHIIEVKVEHRAVMLRRADENRRLFTKEKIMRIVRMEREWCRIDGHRG